MRFASVILSIAIVAAAAILSAKLHPAGATTPQVVTYTHFECYQPSQPGPPPPAPRNVVTLTDQFHTYTTQVNQSVLVCTPVIKKLQPGVSPLPTPTKIDHLLCYTIKGPPANRRAFLQNQLQRQTMTIVNPVLLCVPTNKHLL